MIARIAGRGHSFKGAGMYYLHDKESQTTERVAWTQTRNMPVNDNKAAINWMSYTAMNANKLKQEAGIPMTGRKREKGVVYTFSLSWSPDEKPDRERMEKAADETLEVLGLKNHQSLIVAHDDTKHPHIHIICNLINPNDGRMYDPDWGSKLKLSDWSLKHEFENGKVYCEQRLENSQERKNGKQVRYKEPVHDRKAEIQELYRQSDNGAAFTAALEKNGYTLSKGNRRRFVLVDDTGKIHSLSRQLDKDQRKEHLQKLSDLTHRNLPLAQEVAADRQYFDRDKQEREQQDRIEKAAIEEVKRELIAEKIAKQNIQNQKIKSKKDRVEDTNKRRLSKTVEKQPLIIEPVYKRYDRIKKWEDDVEQKRQKLKEEMKRTYERDYEVQQISDLEKQIAANDNLMGRMSGRLSKLKKELEAKKLTLSDIDKRIAEQTNKLEKDIAETKPSDYWGEGNKKEEPKKEQSPKPVIDLEEERKLRKMEEYEKRMRQHREQRAKDLDKDFDLGR